MELDYGDFVVSQVFKPRPYQSVITVHELDQPRVAVWASMGMGKSVSTLNAIDLRFVAGEDHPVLVVAPLRVARSVWTREAAKWRHLSHITVSEIVGDQTQRLRALAKNASVYTINFDNIQWLVKHFGTKWPFRTIVCDESGRLGGFRLRHSAQQARALGAIAHKGFVKYWINLTGTPAPNGLAGLWGQTWFLDQGERLGRTYESFCLRWFERSFDGFSWVPRPNAAEQIHEKLKDICLSINPADYFDLQQPIVTNVYVDLPDKAMQHYRDMEKKMYTEIGDNPIEAFNAASRTMKCLQLAGGASYTEDDDGSDTRPWVETHTEKLQALKEIIAKAAGMPVLVSYLFKSDLARLLKAFPKGRQLKSLQDEDDWNAGKIPVAFGHPRSIGHGVNLQDGGNILVFFSHWWDLEQRMQMLERIGPMRQLQSGYNRPVFVYDILARATIDELVIKRVETKRSVQDLLLEACNRFRRAA